MIELYLKTLKENQDKCYVIGMEECSELTKELSKYYRGYGSRKRLLEEICDVFICISWYRELFNITNEEFDKQMELKFNRMLERINRGEF